MYNDSYRAKRTLYIGEPLRKTLDRIVLDIGYHTGRPIEVAEFLRFLVEKHGAEARDRLKEIYSPDHD